MTAHGFESARVLHEGASGREGSMDGGIIGIDPVAELGVAESEHAIFE